MKYRDIAFTESPFALNFDENLARIKPNEKEEYAGNGAKTLSADSFQQTREEGKLAWGRQGEEALGRGWGEQFALSGEFAPQHHRGVQTPLTGLEGLGDEASLDRNAL